MNRIAGRGCSWFVRHCALGARCLPVHASLFRRADDALSTSASGWNWTSMGWCRSRIVVVATEPAFQGDSATFDDRRSRTERFQDCRWLTRSVREHDVTYTYQAGTRTLQVRYELQPGWHFVSKRIVLVAARRAKRADVQSVQVSGRGTCRRPIAREHRANRATGGVFLRFGTADATLPCGAFLRAAESVPGLGTSRPTSDHVLCAGHAVEAARRALRVRSRVHRRVCAHRHANRPHTVWRNGSTRPDPEQCVRADPAARPGRIRRRSPRCVEAFQLFRPQKSLRVHVPWCENDYQIDVGTPEGRTRVQTHHRSGGGCWLPPHALYAREQEVSSLAENADAWGWENVLWLGLGQKIRKSEWNIEKDPLPASVQELMDYARQKQVQFVAYVYPTLGWKQNAEWTAWCQGKTGGYRGCGHGRAQFPGLVRRPSWWRSISAPASAATASIIGGSPTRRRTV